MQLQFQQKQQPCLRLLVSQAQNAEQVQELRLSEEMPDIGRVLSCWGQVLLRGKEWGNGSMSVSGGVMAWALYEPEEPGAPQVVEAWLPFQIRWDVPQTQRDGKILCKALLRGVDARSTSARKLIIRANVSVLGQAYGPEKITYYSPQDVPEDVQLRKTGLPARLAMETGEKLLDLDEELTLPAGKPAVHRLLRFCVRPELAERRVMADKVVFRGVARTHILYCDSGNAIHTAQWESPFSQYAELDEAYGPEAEADVLPMLTNLELEPMGDGVLRLKATMTGQYMVYDRPVLELVQDAYSPIRSVTAAEEALTIPTVLEIKTQSVNAEATADERLSQVVDTGFYPQFPQYSQGVGELAMEGKFQVLGYDSAGMLQTVTSKWEQAIPMEASGGSRVQGWMDISGWPQAAAVGAQMSMSADGVCTTVTTAMETWNVITALEMSEQTPPDPNRPSLVLCPSAGKGLWELAKENGSTVERICQANGLETEPKDNTWLLIPVV